MKESSHSNDSYTIFTPILFLSILLAATIVIICIIAAVPPVSRDALTHHLFVPRLYVEHGGIYEIPDIPFSYYPMNLDLLYMIPLYFGNDIIPKYIHFIFALLTAWLIYNYLKNRLSIVYGLLGALFFISVPIIIKLSITVYVDLGLMFFTTASLLLLFKWIESGHKTRYLILAGICCGLAAGTKYNGLITLFLLTLFVPILYIRSSQNSERLNNKAITCGMAFVVVALLSFSPWLIRNTIWTGNPIYPLYNSIFQTSSSSTANRSKIDSDKPRFRKISTKISSHKGTGVFVTRKVLYHETWWQTLLLPLRFFFEGQDDNPRYFDGKLNPFLLILPFFAFIGSKKEQKQAFEQYTLLAFSILFFFFTFFQEALRIRYIASIIPFLTILSIYGIHNIFSVISHNQAGLLIYLGNLLKIAIICVIIFYNSLYIAEQFSIVQPIPYISHKISREDYITRFRPEYPAIQFANKVVRPDEKVLCIFLGNRGYYMNFGPIFDRPFQKGILKDIINASADDIKTELLKQNIHYILLRDDLTQYWLARINKANRKKILSFFRKDIEQLFGEKGYSFFIINPVYISDEQLPQVR